MDLLNNAASLLMSAAIVSAFTLVAIIAGAVIGSLLSQFLLGPPRDPR